MPARDPNQRRKINALYYDRTMLDPEKKAVRRAREARWRERNRFRLQEQWQRRYERHRERFLFEGRLTRLLYAIRRAAIAKGLEPFDG